MSNHHVMRFFVLSGRWDSIHVVETKSKTANSFSYKLTSTILVDLNVKNDKIGTSYFSILPTFLISEKKIADNSPQKFFFQYLKYHTFYVMESDHPNFCFQAQLIFVVLLVLVPPKKEI